MLRTNVVLSDHSVTRYHGQTDGNERVKRFANENSMGCF